MALIVTSGSRIWLRNLDGLAALPLAGTEGARALFWAPDSDQLAFTTARELKKLRVSDGTVQPLCDSCQPAGGGTWSRNGMIVFTTLEGSLARHPGCRRGASEADQRGSIARRDHPHPSLFPAGWRPVSVRETKQGRDPKRAVRRAGSALRMPSYCSMVTSLRVYAASAWLPAVSSR